MTALGLGIIGFAAAVASLYASPIDGVTDLGCGRVFDCSEILGSRWGAVAGLPLGVLGGAYFATWMTLLCLDHRPSPAPAIRACLTAVLAVGAAVSLFLLGVLLFALEGSCLYCLVTHAANLVVIGLLFPFRTWPIPAGALGRSVRPLLGAALVGVLVAVGLQSLYLVRVERAEAKAAEQTIW